MSSSAIFQLASGLSRFAMLTLGLQISLLGCSTSLNTRDNLKHGNIIHRPVKEEIYNLIALIPKSSMFFSGVKNGHVSGFKNGYVSGVAWTV